MSYADELLDEATLTRAKAANLKRLAAFLKEPADLSHFVLAARLSRRLKACPSGRARMV